MSVFLVTSSFVTTLLIPPAAFEDGGPASGRALAYLAHGYLGNGFGTVYDVSTIAILWFAGASAMAGMLNLIPRYLPALRHGARTGPAPSARWCWCSPRSRSWSPGSSTPTSTRRAARTPPACWCCSPPPGAAVTLAARRAGQRRLAVAFAVITLVFVYTTVDNVIERPDGVKIGACFIAGILAVSIASRLSRSFELRTTDVRLDATAELFLRDCARRTIRLVANEPDARDREEYDDKLRQIRARPRPARRHRRDLRRGDRHRPVGVRDRRARRARRGDARRLPGAARWSRRRCPTRWPRCCCTCATAPGSTPHIYFEWTEGNPAANFLRFLLFGVGRGRAGDPRGAASRRAATAADRPHVHVGSSTGAQWRDGPGERSRAHRRGPHRRPRGRGAAAPGGRASRHAVAGRRAAQRVRRPPRPRRRVRPRGAAAAATR